MTDVPKRIVRAAEMPNAAQTFSHPLNPDSAISFVQLSPLTALTRLGVSLARVPPGKEGFAYHRHDREEEWVYILEGAGESDIDDVVERVGPGDFLGYPAGVAHTLRNVGDGDLVYLMGGERLFTEVADFPRHGKRLVRHGDRVELVDESAFTPFWPQADT